MVQNGYSTDAMRITSTVSQFVIEWEQRQFAAPPRSIAALKQALAGVKEIESITLSGPKKNRIVVVYRSHKSVIEFLREITQTIRSSPVRYDDLDESILEFDRKNPSPAPGQPGTLLSGVRRLAYAGLAFGAFGMAWVGLIVPGIPTVPFVILTVYFAEKVSPTFRNMLIETPIIGTAMQDWSEHHALRRSVRDRVFIFIGLMIAMSLLMTPVDSIPFAFVVVFACLSIYIICQIPVIDDPETKKSPGLRVA